MGWFALAGIISICLAEATDSALLAYCPIVLFFVLVFLPNQHRELKRRRSNTTTSPHMDNVVAPRSFSRLIRLVVVTWISCGVVSMLAAGLEVLSNRLIGYIPILLASILAVWKAVPIVGDIDERTGNARRLGGRYYKSVVGVSGAMLAAVVWFTSDKIMEETLGVVVHVNDLSTFSSAFVRALFATSALAGSITALSQPTKRVLC